MSEQLELEKRVEKLEDAQNRPAHGSIRPVVAWLIAIVIASVITVNFYLMTSQMSRASAAEKENAFWSLCHAGLTPVQRAECFLQLAAAGNTEWRSALLDNLDLRGIDLAGVRVESGRLTSCNFSGVRMTGAILEGSALDLSDLTKADLSKAKLRNATLFKTVLLETDFRNADLLSASLEQSNAQKAKFVAAKMGDAFLPMADLTGADLTGADLSGANLEATILKETELALANLYGTRLEDADFTDSNWWRARGLDSQQIDVFILMFPPTPNSSESRRRDFKIWLTHRIESINKTKTP